MLCKLNPKSKALIFILGVGLVSLAFGVITFLTANPQEHHIATLFGMFSGFGAGLMAVALFKLIRAKLISPEKREEEEIRKNDERTIAVTRAAFTVGFFAGAAMLVFLIFLFTFLDYRVASYLCMGALYVQMIAFLLANRVYDKKM